MRGVGVRTGQVQVSLSAMADGTSNTIMIGEMLPLDHDHSTWAGSWAAFNGGGVHHGTLPPINTKTNKPDCNDPGNTRVNWNVSWGFKSNHSGGANFVFGDGSVRFLQQNIDHRTYQLLGCRNDDMPVEIP